MPGSDHLQDGSARTVKVNLAVCGRFHYHNYVRFLAEQGVLNRFYYSHRLSTNYAFLGVRREQAINVWPKEYLLGIHHRLLGLRLEPQMVRLYVGLWQAGALRRWTRAEVLHRMLHGNELAFLQRAKREGSAVVVEAVNRHPDDVSTILDEEREILGLKRERGVRGRRLFQLEEAARSDFLLAPSKIVRDSFVKRGYDARRTAVLPYGVNTDRFWPLEANGVQQNDSVFRVLCVAQLSLRKGQVYLLEAWKRLGLCNAELLLIGAPSNEMVSILNRYRGIFRHITAVPNKQLREYYARASVFVLPSLEDGFAVVCAEAMGCGVPVITTSSNGASEVIEHGKDGFVVPPRSAEAIAECVERLYRDANLRREMSAAVVAKARAQLGWDTYAAKLCKVYQMATNQQLASKRE